MSRLSGFMECTAYMCSARLDEVECVEGGAELVPLLGVASRETHFEVTDARPGKFAGSRQGFDDLTDRWLPEALDHAGVDEVSQRHASARSSRWASARRSSASAIRWSLGAPARRSASFTVSLIVVVPSSHRAAPSISSSRSTKCFATQRVYILDGSVYLLSAPRARRRPLTSPRRASTQAEHRG